MIFEKVLIFAQLLLKVIWVQESWRFLVPNALQTNIWKRIGSVLLTHNYGRRPVSIGHHLPPVIYTVPDIGHPVLKTLKWLICFLCHCLLHAKNKPTRINWSRVHFRQTAHSVQQLSRRTPSCCPERENLYYNRLAGFQSIKPSLSMSFLNSTDSSMVNALIGWRGGPRWTPRSPMIGFTAATLPPNVCPTIDADIYQKLVHIFCSYLIW